MKKFVVIGEARAGTSFVCNVLNQYNDISFCPNIEPFSHSSKNSASEHIGKSILDFDTFLQNLPKNSYSGFKTFYRYHGDLEKTISDYDLFPICVARKNAMKFLGSCLIILQSKMDPYLKSSKKYPKYRFDNSPEAIHVVLVHLDNFLKSHVYMHKYHKDNIIYFEDFVNNKSCTNNQINEYFDRKIVFNSQYDDNHSHEIYFENYDQIQKIIKNYIENNRKVYSIVSEEVMEQLINL